MRNSGRNIVAKSYEIPMDGTGRAQMGCDEEMSLITYIQKSLPGNADDAKFESNWDVDMLPDTDLLLNLITRQFDDTDASS